MAATDAGEAAAKAPGVLTAPAEAGEAAAAAPLTVIDMAQQKVERRSDAAFDLQLQQVG